jgi:hypothetical protein
MLPSLVAVKEAPCKSGKAEPELNLKLQLRCIRPALTDWRFRGDAWIVDQGNGTLAVRLGDYNLTEVAGLPLDLPALNQILARIWNRRPRPLACSSPHSSLRR